MKDAMLVAHELLCFVLIFTVFCRAVRMDNSVRIDVRLAFFLLGAVACIGVPAPWVWGFSPNMFTLFLLGGITLVQIVTSRYWRVGVPLSFYRPDRMPCRRATDREGEAHGHS